MTAEERAKIRARCKAYFGIERSVYVDALFDALESAEAEVRDLRKIMERKDDEILNYERILRRQREAIAK